MSHTSDRSNEPPWFTIGSDRVRLLRNGAEAFPAMLAAIERAEQQILLEMYWVGDDSVGRAFRDALVAKARSGVQVRVIFDGLGSFAMPRSWWSALRKAGGEVAEFHAIWPFGTNFEWSRIERRNHRKILIIDNHTGFCGGLNMSRQWATREMGGEEWRDDALELIGPITQELQALFFTTWRRMKHPLERHKSRSKLNKPSGKVWLLTSDARRRRNVHDEYVRRIQGAHEMIDIANPYFVPTVAVRRALYHAVRRGVRVRVMVPIRGDLALVQFAVEALFDSLLQHGIEIYAHRGAMMHSKTAIIDSSFTTIGSYNLDERSRHNLEANIAIEDEAFARHVRASFEHDLSSSARIDLTWWRSRDFSRRACEWVAFALREFW